LTTGNLQRSTAMTQSTFNVLANSSVRNAQIQAERAGLSQATIETWLRAIGKLNAPVLCM
jgi:hypothetical protein